MANLAHLDDRYFVDGSVYNCPFCNRNHVPYKVEGEFAFNWSDKKVCKCYLVKCESCDKKSMHLTFVDLKAWWSNADKRYHFDIATGTDAGKFLDEAFFYSVPTSFFVLDGRIPRILRELLAEAEGCLKSNYLTGASACARKVVYELGVLKGAAGDNYEDRIKSLKILLPEVDPAFFDTLLTVQQLTSTKVHEGSYDGWESKHLRVILSSLSEVLHEIYVVPALKEERRKDILRLKDELSPKDRAEQKQLGSAEATTDAS
jgi:hypothetical protein